jgi:hypothetical protein
MLLLTNQRSVAIEGNNGVSNFLPCPQTVKVALPKGLVSPPAGLQFGILAVAVHQQLSCPPDVYVFHDLAAPISPGPLPVPAISGGAC